MTSRSKNPARLGPSARHWPRLALCAALLCSSACGQKVDDPNTDSALAEPDLGPDAVVCGELGDVVTSDGEIAAAGIAGCQIYRGHISVGPLVADPSALGSLRVIRGGVGAGGFNPYAESLEGLENVEWVGDFSFLADGIRELSPVAKLEKVGGVFGLRDMPNLTDLRGLEQLRIIGGNASISYNSNLTSIEGLAGLERVLGDLQITENPQLPREQVDALLARIEVDGEVYVD